MNAITARIIKLCALIAIPFCSGCALYEMRNMGDGAGGTPSSSRDTREEERYSEWVTWFPHYITPRICEYYRLHPERFKATGRGEEIEIVGFPAFIKEDGYFKERNLFTIRVGELRDPWGEPVHFVQDLNMDGFIEVNGERYKVQHGGSGQVVQVTNQEHHFGILKATPFKKSYTTSSDRWQRVVAVTF